MVGTWLILTNGWQVVGKWSAGGRSVNGWLASDWSAGSDQAVFFGILANGWQKVSQQAVGLQVVGWQVIGQQAVIRWLAMAYWWLVGW